MCVCVCTRAFLLREGGECKVFSSLFFLTVGANGNGKPQKQVTGQYSTAMMGIRPGQHVAVLQ